MASVPSKCTNATVTRRCSGSWLALRTESKIATGMHRDRSAAVSTGSRGVAEVALTAGARSQQPSSVLCRPKI